MSFNTALSGLAAAQADLRITGNNIANASTIGFKESRAEFGNVYASTLVGSGDNRVGAGVRLANVAQQFSQGNITFTNNSLDLAIDGNGFFILGDGGATSYTRAGLFGLDENGFLVTNQGLRLQGFTANGNGIVAGTLNDLRVESTNLAPRATTAVTSGVNLDSRASVLSRIGTLAGSDGPAVGVARAGLAQPTPSTLQSSGPPVPFDFSIDSTSTIAATDPLVPFDFSVDAASAVTAPGSMTGFDFSVNSPSTLSATSAPIGFNFSDKPSALSGSSDFTAFDFSGGNGASFDVTISGSPANGTRTVTLNSNHATLAGLVADINGQLAGIGVQARVNPADADRLQLVATSSGVASTLQVGNFTVNGTTSTGNLSAALSGLADGATSVRSSFDVTVSGTSANGTATINLTGNHSTLASLVASVRTQLQSSGIAAGVREDPLTAGRLQFFATENGVAAQIGIGNIATSDAGVTVADLNNLLRFTDGASTSAPGAGASATIGSLTRATFDVSISGGSGPGGSATATVTLDQDYSGGDFDALVDDINTQLAAAVPAIDVRAEEDPAVSGRLRFVATVSGEPSTVTVGNYQVAAVAGDQQVQVADVAGVLGGLTAGTSDNGGSNSAASFVVNVAGASTPGANGNAVVTLDRNITTLQDLIADINEDLAAAGIGVIARENPAAFGRLQFAATTSGEASTISIDPSANATFGPGTSRADVEAALGGIALGQGAVGGSSNVLANPFGGSGASSTTGNLTSATFDVTLSGASTGNGTVQVRLDSDITSLADLIADIRDELAISGVGVDVREDPDNAGRLQFHATRPGEASTISIANLDTTAIGVTQANLTNVLSLATGVTVPGEPAIGNGYAAQSIDVVDAAGNARTVTTAANASAAAIAAQFSSTAVEGVSATATTRATLPAAGVTDSSGTLAISVNGIAITGSNPVEWASAIASTAGLGTLSATVTAGGDLEIVDPLGNDIVVGLATASGTDQVTVQGSGGAPVILGNGSGTDAAAIGGTVQFTLEEGYTLAGASPAASNLFAGSAPAAFVPFAVNTFDPQDAATYNAATSVTVFDSLGNSHVLTQYFVRERPEPGIANSIWSMYVLIDGADVGDPDPNLPAPANAAPTRAQFRLEFTPDGRFSAAGSDPILVSNWTPLDADGNPNGAIGPQNVLAGGGLPIPDPPVSSNMALELVGATQFGTAFSVNSVDQNGFATGRLLGVEVGGDGLLSARYTNGENQILGQVALANFANAQGLKSVGDTAWEQSFDSGEPVIGTPSTASLGSITAGALEDSNVELSEQLVNLILAQRNFQANARTISTADEVTQTIINI